MMSARILGTGTSLPPHALTQAEAVALLSGFATADQNLMNSYSRLFSLTGIKSRYSCILGFEQSAALHPSFRKSEAADTKERMQIYKDAACRLAVQACKDALYNADCAAESITHLIIVTCTGFVSPAADLSIIESLKLSHSIERIFIGFMGCHGAINAIRTARSIVQANPAARILLCSVEVCSIHVSATGDAKSAVADSLFSDGSAALLIADSNSREFWDIGAGSARLIPGTADEMSWIVENNGFSMSLSGRVPSLLKANTGQWLKDYLEKISLEQDEIRSWIIHPGGLKILNSIQQALNLQKKDLKDCFEIFEGFGNMSSATVLFILKRMIDRSANRPALMLGFGPGLFCESVSFN